MFIDSHCHLDKLDLPASAANNSSLLTCEQQALQSLVEECAQVNVNRMLSVCVGLDEFANMYQLIEPFSQIDASVGVHPLHIKGEDQICTVASLIELANQHPKVVAIGETGLDYYYDEQSKALQKESFARHLQAANQLDLPVIVHTRQARQDTLDLIAAHSGKAAGVLHCFTESLEMAMQAIDLGYSISISGIVTFKNSTALKEIVKALPIEKLLIETDSPYLAPIPYRGKQNQPKYVVEVAQYVADLKGLDLAALGEITSDNYFRLFNKASALSS